MRCSRCGTRHQVVDDLCAECFFRETARPWKALLVASFCGLVGATVMSLTGWVTVGVGWLAVGSVGGIIASLIILKHLES